MTNNDIGILRAIKQQIAGTGTASPIDTVSRMTAMQAQDYAMAKWAVGIRTQRSTDQMVEEAFNRGEFLRTHVLRPTWHFVAAEDIHWMLELSAPRIKSSMASRHKQLELTTPVIHKSNDLIVKQLSDHDHLSRKDLVAELEKAGFSVQDNRSAHLLLLAELEGLICSGPVSGKDQTYALLDKRAPHKKRMTHDEALTTLASRYFTSRGPATLEDFVWWSNLGLKDARKALEMAKPGLQSTEIDSVTYWFPETIEEPFDKSDAVHLLPAYDEFIICYKDRSAVLVPEYRQNVISKNGIFWPVIVLNGQVKGLWKRTIKKDKVIIETDLFQPLPNNIMKMIEQQAKTFVNFLGKPEWTITHKMG